MPGVRFLSFSACYKQYFVTRGTGYEFRSLTSRICMILCGFRLLILFLFGLVSVYIYFIFLRSQNFYLEFGIFWPGLSHVYDLGYGSVLF